MRKIIRATTVPGTLNVFCKGLLHELSKKYEVVALSSPSPVLDEVRSREGVRTIAVPMARHVSILKDLKSLFAIIRVFRHERPDMVHSMTPKAGLLCMVSAWITRVPIRVHTFTGLVFPTAKGFRKWYLAMMDRIICLCATNIIPEGEGVKNDLIDNKITKKDIRVLGYGNIRGIDLGFYKKTSEIEQDAQALRRPWNFCFVFVGRVVRDKGINELCEAFDRLSREFPDIRLFIVGKNEDKLDPVSIDSKRIMRENSQICACGKKNSEDLLSYYAASDCLVFPSYREGFPNTVIEAGAMGLPSIVTDINGSREIIRNGYNGVIIPPRDVEALYSAMREMYLNSERRLEMASVARQSVAERFEQKYVWNCLFEFYTSVFKRHEETKQ